MCNIKETETLGWNQYRSYKLGGR